MKQLEYPGLYADVSAISARGQTTYVWLAACYLATLVIAAGIASLSVDDETHTARAIAAAFVFCLSLLAALVIGFGSFEKQWYGGRAAAESIKSMTWKYMMRVTPYDESDDAATSRLIADLRTIVERSKELRIERVTVARAGYAITPKMTHVRGLSVAERAEVYRMERVTDQVAWYSAKAASNASQRRVWYTIVTVLHLCALVFAFKQIWRPSRFDSLGFLAAAAAATVAWLQLKRYQELAQSYAIAAHDLGLAAAAFGGRELTQTHMADIVQGAEAAISREHTLWIARRST